jgi:hypothetical protein
MSLFIEKNANSKTLADLLRAPAKWWFSVHNTKEIRITDFEGPEM